MANEFRRDGESSIGPYVILGAGALIGVAMLIGSGVLFYLGWTPLVDWIREGKEEKLWQPLLAVVLALAGEGIMFAAFQSAQRSKRTNPTMRRLLYGYNAAFTANLLLILLLAINVVIQVRYPSPIDMTAGGFYSLSDVTRKYVESLDRPVHVYMILEPDDEAYASTETLLSQMQDLNPKYFTFEKVATINNRSQIAYLKKTFSQFNGRAGLLVAVGEHPEKNHSYIDSSELSNFNMERGSQRPQREFNGEVRVMQELQFLANDKKKPVLYFTQGHGEPDLNGRRNDDLGSLRQRLVEANFDVRPLTVSGADVDKFSIPDDAELVVIVGPTASMADLVPALTRYMKPIDPKHRKGKLLVFLGPTPADRAHGNTMREVGLEGLLREFNVDATNEQVLTFAFPYQGRFVIDQSPEAVFVAPTDNAVEARHPLAQMLKDQNSRWFNVRQIRPAVGGNPAYRSEVVLGSYGMIWLESNMQTSPLTQQKVFATDLEERKKRVQREPVSVAVAVTETSKDPHAAEKPGGGQTPRIMIVGCSTITANIFQQPRAGGMEFDIVKGCIEWCRERYSAIGIQPKSHQYFMLPKSTSSWMLFYLPWLAMLLSIGGFGLVVWTVRRR